MRARVHAGAQGAQGKVSSLVAVPGIMQSVSKAVHENICRSIHLIAKAIITWLQFMQNFLHLERPPLYFAFAVL